MGGWSCRLPKHKCPGGLLMIADEWSLMIADEWSLTPFPAIRTNCEFRISFAK